MSIEIVNPTSSYLELLRLSMKYLWYADSSEWDQRTVEERMGLIISTTRLIKTQVRKSMIAHIEPPGNIPEGCCSPGELIHKYYELQVISLFLGNKTHQIDESGSRHRHHLTDIGQSIRNFLVINGDFLNEALEVLGEDLREIERSFFRIEPFSELLSEASDFSAMRS